MTISKKFVDLNYLVVVIVFLRVETCNLRAFDRHREIFTQVHWYRKHLVRCDFII